MINLTCKPVGASMSALEGNLAALEREYTRIGRNTSIEKVVRQSCRRVCSALAFQTQPFGWDAGQKGMERRIAADASYVFWSQNKLFTQISGQNQALAKAIYRASKQGDASAVRKLLKGTPYAALPVTVRVNPDTYAKRRVGRHSHVRNDHNDRTIVIGNDRVETFIQKVQSRIGMTKQGWADCAREVGGTVRGIPRWVARVHMAGRRLGVVTRFPNGQGVGFTMENTTPWVSEVLTNAQIQSALDYEAKVTANLLDRTMRASARKFNAS